MTVVAQEVGQPLERSSALGKEFLDRLKRTVLVRRRRLERMVEDRYRDEEGRAAGAAPRSEREGPFRDAVRAELVELARSLRLEVLGQRARADRAWVEAMDLAEAVDTVLRRLPEVVEAPVEPLLALPESARAARRFRRWLLRLQRRVAPRTPTRRVRFRDFVRYHLHREEISRLEGVATMILQAHAHLEGRAWTLYRQVSAMLTDLEGGRDGLLEQLASVKVRVEEQVAWAAREFDDYLADARRRAESKLQASLRSAAEELPRIGTLELPNSARRPSRLARAHARARASLHTRLDLAKRAVIGGYGLTALRLEEAAFVLRLEEALDLDRAALETEARGRLLTQIARVRASLAALRKVEEPTERADPDRTGDLRGGDAKAGDGAGSEEDRLLEDLLRKLRDAKGQCRDLQQERLGGDKRLGQIPDLFDRAVWGLTERYVVPVSRLPVTEWTVPPAPLTVEVELAKGAAELARVELQGRLTRAGAEAADGLKRLLGQFDDVFAIVGLGGEAEHEGHHASPPERQIRKTMLENAEGLLGQLERDALRWLERLLSQLDEARSSLPRFHERLLEAAVPVPLPGSSEGLDLRERGMLWLRGAVAGTALGERLLRSLPKWAKVVRSAARPVWRPGGPAAAAAEPEAQGSVRPVPAPGLPKAYEIMFLNPATGPGGAVAAYAEPLAALRQRLSRRALDGRLRSAAILGFDGLAQEYFGDPVWRVKPRRLGFTEPATVEGVKKAMQEVSGEGPVIVSGFSWLASAGPGGFEPLRVFLERVLDDAGRHAFLVEADRLPWRWASAAAPLADVFPQVFDPPPLRPEDIESNIRDRHRLAGHEIGFDHDGARIAFFSELHRVAEGRLPAALPYWLASVEGIDEDDGKRWVRVKPAPPDPYRHLAGLGRDDAHLLYLVARQGWMSASVLATLLGRRRLHADAALARLFGQHLLHRLPSGLFVPPPHLGHAIEAFLAERGWV